ncbi:MAG: hypothetical protein ABSC55_25120 [Syntrophorhabdales bacterium]
MGSSREIDAAGPSPGRTPISVPIKTPMKHKRRLIGSKAQLNANCRLLRRSTKNSYIPNTPFGSSTFSSIKIVHDRKAVKNAQINVIFHLCGSIDLNKKAMKRNVVKRYPRCFKATP